MVTLERTQDAHVPKKEISNGTVNWSCECNDYVGGKPGLSEGVIKKGKSYCTKIRKPPLMGAF